MKRRMNNLFRRDGFAFILAMDHAAMMKSPALGEPGRIIREAAAGGADAFLTTLGIVKNYASDFGRAGIILRADGGISALKMPMDAIEQLYTAEDALRAGADAMLCMGYPGSAVNEHSLKYLAKLAADCDRWGLPLGAEMLPYGFEKVENSRSVENIAFACRQGAELGADFIKTEFVGGEEFKKVTEGCYAPVLVLGGSGAKSDEELLLSVKGAMDAGAKGVIMGRNIYRRENVAGICEAVAAVIHDHATVEEALRLI